MLEAKDRRNQNLSRDRSSVKANIEPMGAGGGKASGAPKPFLDFTPALLYAHGTLNISFFALPHVRLLLLFVSPFPRQRPRAEEDNECIITTHPQPDAQFCTSGKNSEGNTSAFAVAYSLLKFCRIR